MSQGSRLKAVLLPVERRQTELHHAPLWTRCCRTWASHKEALSSSGTGQGTGCCSLEETGNSCLSHSGTQESAGSCSQTTGCCTDCMETWREGITLTIHSVSKLESSSRFKMEETNCYASDSTTVTVIF